MYRVTLRWPAWPLFLNDSSYGNTTVSSYMAIDAEVYGMIPNANTVKHDSAPPESRLDIPGIPPDCCWKSCAS